MNGAHWHLLVNHVSLFGVAFGFLALVWSMFKKNPQMQLFAIILFLISGVFAWIANETGESAEEVVEHLAGVTKALIHDHEEAAEAANVSVIILALGSFGLLVAAKFKPVLIKGLQILVLVCSVVSTALLARTANLGGQIRHSEIRKDALSQGAAKSESSLGDETGEDED